MAATMMCKSFAGTSLRQAVPTTGKVRGVLPIRCLEHVTPFTSYIARGERGDLWQSAVVHQYREAAGYQPGAPLIGSAHTSRTLVVAHLIAGQISYELTELTCECAQLTE